MAKKKDWWFKFEIEKWEGGTSHLNFEERGFYLHLLLMQFKTGHLTEKAIRFHLGSYSVSIWESIKDKFEIDHEGKFYNSKMDQICKQRDKRSEINTDNGILGGRPRKDGTPAESKAKPKQNQIGNQTDNQFGNRNDNQTETDSNTLLLYNSESLDSSKLQPLQGNTRGVQGGSENYIDYPANFWEGFYKRFHDSYGAYGYPWKTREVMDGLRGAVTNVLGKWREMGRQADYRDAADFLCECALIAQQSDVNAKRDKRKAPHNWLADQNYLTNPAEAVPKPMTEAEIWTAAITKAVNEANKNKANQQYHD